MEASWRRTLFSIVVMMMATAVSAVEPGSNSVDSINSIDSVEQGEELIPVPQIPNQTDALQHALRRISHAASPDFAISKIEAKLSGVRSQNTLQMERATELLTRGPTLDQIGDFDRNWARRQSSLRSWRETIARGASSLEVDLEELTRLRRLWSRTFANAQRSGVPDAVLATISTNLNAIDTTSERLRKRRAVVLTLLTAVTEDEREATALRERIAGARGILRAQILEPDSAPLWSVRSVPSSDLTGLRIRESIQRSWIELVDFAQRRARSMAPVAFAFVVSLLIAIYFRERLRDQSHGKTLEGSIKIFERPVSVALVTTVVVAAVLFPMAPRFVRDCVGVLLIFPLIRLLIPVVPAALVKFLGVLVTFHVAERIRNVIAAADLLERLLFLGEMIAAAAIIWHFLRPSRFELLAKTTRAIAEERENSFLAVLGAALKLTLVAFCLSAAANLLGYVALSKILGEGTLGGIYLAILAYAIYRIVTALVVVGLSSRLGTWIGVLRSNSDFVLRSSRWILGSLAFLFWVLATLEGFEIREPVVDAIHSALSTPLRVGTLSISLGDILAFPLTMLLAFCLSRAIRSLLREDIYPRVTLARGVGNAVSTTAHYVLLLGGFFIALGASGIDLGRFTILAGAFGVGIGFGLQNVVNNFVSGLILLFERPIQAGDHIELGGLLGEIKHIGIRASTVLTFQGAEVVVPNGDLLSGQLINWTLSNKHRRVELPVGVAYGNRPSDVIEVLERVLDREERILRNPEPVVLFRGFGDSSLDFELRFWARDYMTYVLLKSDVASTVYNELETAGITIPFPQRDLHIKSVGADVVNQLSRGDDSK